MNQGELNGRAKLTEQDVFKIKKLLKLGHTQRDIGERFGVYSSTISMINTGKLWKHLGKTAARWITEDDMDQWASEKLSWTEVCNRAYAREKHATTPGEKDDNEQNETKEA